MSVTQIADVREVKDLISSQPFVIVDFMAQWCGPCKMIAPKIKKLAELYPNVTFIKVDVDQMDPSFIASENVSAMPTFRFYKNGKAVEPLTVVGADFRSVQTNVKELLQ